VVSDRIINAYAQAEVRRDTSAYNAANIRHDQLFRSTAYR
jgi:flagellar hook-associated protein 1 FlgK